MGQPGECVCVSAARWSAELALTLRAAGTWAGVRPCVVCLEGVQIFKMVKIFRMLDECSGKRVDQDPLSNVKAKRKVNFRGFLLYSMFMFRLRITWPTERIRGNLSVQNEHVAALSNSLQLRFTIPS